MDETKTVNDIGFDLMRENERLRSLIQAHTEPLKQRIKENEKKIDRLLLEDGRQLVDLTLLDD